MWVGVGDTVSLKAQVILPTTRIWNLGSQGPLFTWELQEIQATLSFWVSSPGEPWQK